MIFNTNYSIEHYSFVCIQLNGGKYCYLSLTFQLNMSFFSPTVKWSNSSISNNSIWYKSFVCTQFKYQTALFDIKIGFYQLLPLQARVDLGVIAVKGYSAFPKVPALVEPHD